VRTINDAHREALAAGCPLASIRRRIDKTANGAPVRKGVAIPEGVSVQAVAVVSVPPGEWRAALLAAGWTEDDGDLEVECARQPAYDAREFERGGLDLGAEWTITPRGDFDLCVHDSGLCCDVPLGASPEPLLQALAAGQVGRYRLIDGELLQGRA
jgi:hypothetical protein